MSTNAFGQFQPGRPDHPDVNKLSDVVLQIDAMSDGRHSQSGADAMSQVLGEYVDVDSVTYTAMQRAMRLSGVNTLADLLAKNEQVSAMTALWLDAFAAGARYQEQYGTKR